jgi:hypothetical protein
MNQEAEQLRLLSIFHFIVAGLAALFSFFPLIYSILGGFLVYAAHHPGPGNQEPPPALVGWIFVVLGALFFVAGIAMAICIFAAARSLARLQTLLVRTCHSLHRMSVRPFRNNSRGVYHRYALARISENDVYDRARSVESAVLSENLEEVTSLTARCAEDSAHCNTLRSGGWRRSYTRFNPVAR